MVFIKKFYEWIRVKQAIDLKNHKPPYFKEREIWWCHIGENVGVETNGKNKNFTRPVIIYKKYDKFSCFVIPLTTKEKVGTWYCAFIHKKKYQNALLSQGRVVSYKRFLQCISKIDTVDFSNITKAFIDLHTP